MKIEEALQILKDYAKDEYGYVDAGVTTAIFTIEEELEYLRDKLRHQKNKVAEWQDDH